MHRCLRAYRQFVCYLCCKNLDSKHPYSPKLSKVYDDLPSWKLTLNITHKLVRSVKYPMLRGMEPFNWLLPRYLHPNIYTSWVRYQPNVYQIKYALHSTFHFFSHPSFIYLGLGAQNDPFKAQSCYAVDSIAVLCSMLTPPSDIGTKI